MLAASANVDLIRRQSLKSGFGYNGQRIIKDMHFLFRRQEAKRNAAASGLSRTFQDREDSSFDKK